MHKENPAEYNRIASIRDGVRSSMFSSHKGLYVFCQAGAYQQLFLIDKEGKIASRDIPRVLGTIKCSPDIKSAKLPPDYNAAVMRIKRLFIEEAKQREAEREYSLSLSYGQRYVLRELRIFFGITSDEEIKGQINILDKAFRGPLTSAIKKELNIMRRNGMTGENLFKALKDIYNQHGMKDMPDRRDLRAEERAIPKIICSEALI
jgi:hypothetical protein